MSKHIFSQFFQPAIRIVADSRPWFRDLALRFNLHPAIHNAFEYADPYNWQQLLLEWPHKAVTDPGRIAYTRDERAGIADKQTITTIGKYLARHFDISDHIIRDIAAQYTATGSEFRFLNTTAEMVNAVNNGPYSCMCWRERDDVRCSDGVHRHPYEVYDPKYGWHMAIRIGEEGRIDARALCNSDDDTKYFVRSYKRCPNGGYSYADEHLEAWLKAQGYVHRGEWHEGVKMAYFETSDDFLAPYIDGDSRNVDVRSHNGEYYLVIDRDGDYCCDNTDGAPENANSTTCDECGERCHDDELHWVDGSDISVCEHCLNHEFTFVIGRRGAEYYVRSSYAVYVESQDQWYDEDYLDNNNIVCLENGEHEHIDNAVHVESADEWYHTDDERIVFDEYNECYELTDNCVCTEDMGYVNKDDAWQCAATDNYYSDKIEPVIIDDEKYHPDHAPETEEPNEE